MTTVYRIAPLTDPRWDDLVERHPRASVFHTPVWLEALRRTYGYEPAAYTTTPPGFKLSNGVVFCQVSSRLTGRRLVSLPFSDHCEPLVERPEDLTALLHSLERDCAREGWKYIELRPRTAGSLLPGVEPAQRFHFHTIDLTSDLTAIFSQFHKDSTQRKSRRAERERLTYEEGRGDALLERFYHLLRRTRRRQQLPPLPLAWFANLLDCLGDTAKIRVASKEGRPIASILTLSFKDVLVYKYGGSDERFHNLGGMHLLFWNAIQDGKRTGARAVRPGAFRFFQLRPRHLQGSLGGEPISAHLLEISGTPVPDPWFPWPGEHSGKDRADGLLLRSREVSTITSPDSLDGRPEVMLLVLKCFSPASQRGQA